MGRKCLTEIEAKARLERISKGAIMAIGKYRFAHIPWHVRCQSCEHEWRPSAASLFQGSGCPGCHKKNRMKFKWWRKSLSNEEALRRLEEISRDKIIALEHYRGIQIPWHVQCRECENKWHILPCNVFRGNGCPVCYGRGFKMDRPAIAYYLRISNKSGGSLYKIGITHRLIKRRYPGESRNLTILKTWDFLTGLEAYEFEQRILRENADHLYRGESNLRTGKSEIFARDVLCLDEIVPQFKLITYA